MTSHVEKDLVAKIAYQLERIAFTQRCLPARGLATEWRRLIMEDVAPVIASESLAAVVSRHASSETSVTECLSLLNVGAV
ncbi:MAG TPA: hypothetical protein V6D17_14015 [Candidatus Obscuribacterales bacterium]